MYCQECGSHNVEEAKYCAECGAYLLEEKKKRKPKKVKVKKKKVYKKKVKKEKKPMAKSTKILLCICFIMITLFLSIYFYLHHITSKEEIAKDYFSALITYDGDKLYKYLEVEESTFVNQKIFSKLSERVLGDKEKNNIKEYSISKSEMSDDGKTAYVTISYIQNGENRYQTITLSKGEDKKYTFFDDWKPAKRQVEMVNDFKISVMKGSTLYLEGIKVDEKYLKEDLCTEEEDVYEIPSLFALSYQAEVELPLGFTIHTEVNAARTIGRYNIVVQDSQIPEKMKNQILVKAKEDIEKIYKSILEEKSFEDIVKDYSYKDGNLDTLKSAYEEMKKKIVEGNTKLEKIGFKKINVNQIHINTDGSFYATIKGEYEYTVSYGEETHVGEGSDVMYLTFDYVDKAFYLKDMKSMQTYFSKYS